MAKKFRELIAKMPPERQRKIKNESDKLYLEMTLNEARKKVASLTQQELAKNLDVRQAAISKIENQANMHISTLRDYLGGMGATLDLVAHFPDRSIIINQQEMKTRKTHKPFRTGRRRQKKWTPLTSKAL